MNRQEKEIAISEVKKLFAQSQAAFLVNYKGLDVAKLQSLRKVLREQNGKFKVTKANLMSIAVEGLPGVDSFKENFKDQVGLVFANKDVPAVSKKLVDFAKDNEALKIIAGYFESKTLSKQDLEILASLPSREILLAQLAGTLQAPISSFVRILNLMIVRLLYVLQKIEDKKKEGQ
jgi:large subunit ribosomal protein L10